jgi:hypothetical protein
MFTLTPVERTEPLSDLAATLTDLALPVLNKAGVRGDSIEMELELWRALTAGLKRQSARLLGVSRTTPELPGVLEDVIHRATLEVAGSFAPERGMRELELKIRPVVAGLDVSSELRVQLGRILAPVEVDRRPLGRSGVVRALRLTALN